MSHPPQPGWYAPLPPDHPKALTALVLGILGVAVCQVAAPFAWSMGKRTMDEIDASQGRLGGRSTALTGYVLGVVGTVLLILAVVSLVASGVLFLVLGGLAAMMENQNL